MTNITVLTKELVEQFELVVGRRVTAAEYIELRKQAMDELNAGYSIPITMQSEPNMAYFDGNTTNCANPGIISTAAVSNPIPAENPRLATNNSETVTSMLTPTKIPSKSNQTSAIESTQKNSTESSDFFKLVNKFM